jgi:hypothetical protein
VLGPCEYLHERHARGQVEWAISSAGQAEDSDPQEADL